MGYFSNGSEGLDYNEKYCFRCVNFPPEEKSNCPVLAIHQIWNYEQCADTSKSRAIKNILGAFIPRDKDGNNEQCRMFIEREGKD